jgi:hypothetical protein
MQTTRSKRDCFNLPGKLLGVLPAQHGRRLVKPWAQERDPAHLPTTWSATFANDSFQIVAQQHCPSLLNLVDS